METFERVAEGFAPQGERLVNLASVNESIERVVIRPWCLRNILTNGGAEGILQFAFGGEEVAFGAAFGGVGYQVIDFPLMAYFVVGRCFEKSA